jgi:hypothetical protein
MDVWPDRAARGDADNVRYDAPARGSSWVTALALSRLSISGQRAGEVKLQGHPESFQLERNGSRIVNVPDARHIAVLDRTAMKLIGTWPVTEAAANYPMALDEANHRLFIGCRNPAMVLIYDTTSGKRVGSSPIVGDTDDLFYDVARKRLYVTGGEGYIDVFAQNDADHLTIAVEQGSTGVAGIDGASIWWATSGRKGRAPSRSTD